MNGDGYTNIVRSISTASIRKKVDWTNLNNNHDTLEGKTSLM